MNGAEVSTVLVEVSSVTVVVMSMKAGYVTWATLTSTVPEQEPVWATKSGAVAMHVLPLWFVHSKPLRQTSQRPTGTRQWNMVGGYGGTDVGQHPMAVSPAIRGNSTAQSDRPSYSAVQAAM